MMILPFLNAFRPKESVLEKRCLPWMSWNFFVLAASEDESHSDRDVSPGYDVMVIYNFITSMTKFVI